MSHTPGPWKIVEDPDTTWGRVEVADDRFILVEGRSEEEAAANVNLCCAAPELLEALKEAYCWIPDGTRQSPEQRGAQCATVYDVEDMIRASIRKAEGRL